MPTLIQETKNLIKLKALTKSSHPSNPRNKRSHKTQSSHKKFSSLQVYSESDSMSEKLSQKTYINP